MLKRLIMWLVKKLFTPMDIAKVAANADFIENPLRVINRLYHAAYSTEQVQQTGILPFEYVAAKRLSEHDLPGSIYIVVLLALQNRLIYCVPGACRPEDYEAFFNKVNTIKTNSNYLKVRKELTDLVCKETLFTDESDMTLVVSVLQQLPINPKLASTFITTGSLK